MEEIGYAKINLALHVRGREPDGYHRIETVFAFAEDGDTLTATAADGLSLAVTGPFAADLAGEADNLVLRATAALRRACGVSAGAALSLDKNLPVAAGIGGGSADAAAALRLLARLWNLSEDRLPPVAAGLGADVPACLRSVTARGEGRGDALAPIEDAKLAGLPVLLVNPGVLLSTPSVFGAWDGVDRGPLGAWEEGRNDLTTAAVGLVPAIAAVLGALADARIARMSGSGATCFGLYATEAERDRAATRIRSAQPAWWIFPTRLR